MKIVPRETFVDFVPRGTFFALKIVSRGTISKKCAENWLSVFTKSVISGIIDT